MSMRFGFFITSAAMLCSLAPALAQPSSAYASKDPTALLVDKRTNQLHVATYADGAYHIVKTFHATLGRVAGDKQDEGDLKTPEGIYTFKNLLRPPSLKPKFGAMAFYMNFPNDFDRMAGYTGFDIMLHATDEPNRLKKDYDSEGCVVVNNDEIKQIQPYIHLGLTPILIFPELTEEFLTPGRDERLKGFFEGWIKAWENKDLDTYVDHYHSDFSAQGKDKSAWRTFKGHLNQIYSTIEVKPEHVIYYRHPKYSVITFTQNYRSKLKGGGWGHVSTGTKILYIAEEQGQPKIISENFSNLHW